MIAISVQLFGDFDMKYTEALLIAPSTYTKKSAQNLARRISDEHDEDIDSSAVIAELKKLGFRTITNVDLTVGGNL